MKNISIKDFEKAKKIHKMILALDYQILQIEKVANEITSDNCNINLEVHVENLSTKKKEISDIEKEIRLKARFHPFMHPLIQPFFAMAADDKEDEKHSFNFSFSDSECLKILDTILRVKYYAREKLLEQLNNLGVTI